MNKQEKIDRCQEFFNELAMILWDTYSIVPSCNQDITEYLVKTGTQDEISYQSKPAKSFRISDHWSWYANTKKCPNENYIQCLNVDGPWANKRIAKGKPSKPINMVQVAVIGDDGKYHAVYGEFYDKKTKTWGFLLADAEEVAKEIAG